ncbi:hypothetical protein [Shewanella sp. MEBiC00475]|uniref:hypothetical protein n=1 Tax=Shewanella sp. MEBiC00475 TaxID=2575361 RepID=UPI0010C134F2|nr:hypothetical protein [Shewanella sp. MEBiC00475]
MHTTNDSAIPLTTATESYQEVTIIGNAHGDWQPAKIGHSFIFNGTQHDDDNVINICNGPYAGSADAFTVRNSLDDTQLVLLLTQVANTLKKQLNCWPSSGLVTLFLMSIVAKHVNVQRMSLLPSLQRSQDMSAGDYLPCMVHNWLGERRLALGLQLTNDNIMWPELLINEATMQVELDASLEMPDINPFEVLLSDLVRQREQKPNNIKFSTAQTLALQVTTERPINLDMQYALLAALSNLPSVHWLSYASQEDLLTAEALFYNEDPQNNTSYWYLVDYQASQFLDVIRHHLAYCQQVFALTAK